MAPLDSITRAKLPDSAFAYIDARGRRRLPIHDEAHVRNALARFSRVAFEDNAARERARTRLLKAAKRFRIVPIGFIDGQLQSERRHARRAGAATATDVADLPTGFITFLMSDIEGSTALVRRLGDRYGDLLNGTRAVLREAVLSASGREIDARADEFFAVFERPADAVTAALGIQRTLGGRDWPDALDVRVRIGIHSGTPTVTEAGYIGLPVHTTARVCAAAHGGQIIVSGDTRTAIEGSEPTGIGFRALGRHRLPGLAAVETLFQVIADGMREKFPPPRRATRAREKLISEARPAAVRGKSERSLKRAGAKRGVRGRRGG